MTSYAAFRFSHVLSSAFEPERGQRTPVLFDWTGGLHKYADRSLRSSFCPGLEVLFQGRKNGEEPLIANHVFPPLNI